MYRQYKLKDYNFRLILWLVSLSSLGILLVGSARASLQSRQLFGVLLGISVMLVLSVIDFSWILHFQWAIYGASLLLLLLVLVRGHTAGGATRWLEFFGFRFQPVELVKILLVLFFAKFFLDHETKISSPLVILRAALFIAVPLFLVFREPDMKNTLMISAVFAILYYAAGLSYKVVLPILCVTAILSGVFIATVTDPDQTLIEPYQRKRIMAFLHPDQQEYIDDLIQQNNSVSAIGSGELTGKGLNNADVTSANKGKFISQIQTDFIFAVAGEELGFLGSAGIVILLLLIVLECLLTARRAKDLAGKLICIGMASLVALQSFINIGVATRILPNTGTPLPFVSYGLTSIVSLYIGMGLVLNVGLQERIVLRDAKKQKGRRRA